MTEAAARTAQSFDPHVTAQSFDPHVTAQSFDPATERFRLAVVEPDQLTRQKGAKKFLGWIPELCMVCGACVDHCPWHCLFMVDASAVEGEAGAELVDDPIADDAPRVIFWVDDDLCTRCNICVERCPTGAITMDKVATPGRRRH